ncbi:MAG: hypothetical protein KatS3mg058_3853 [Roseiflexus sp.]|nr:MAG: hypothetical protein KatS3mg058_3853 [Roseiflexus sp.]
MRDTSRATPLPGPARRSPLVSPQMRDKSRATPLPDPFCRSSLHKCEIHLARRHCRDPLAARRSSLHKCEIHLARRHCEINLALRYCEIHLARRHCRDPLASCLSPRSPLASCPSPRIRGVAKTDKSSPRSPLASCPSPHASCGAHRKGRSDLPPAHRRSSIAGNVLRQRRFRSSDLKSQERSMCKVERTTLFKPRPPRTARLNNNDIIPPSTAP